MTDIEQYHLLRSLYWRQELDRYDSAIVASLMESLKRIQLDVEEQITANLLTGSGHNELNTERLSRLDTWIDDVINSTAATTEAICQEAGIQSAIASQEACVAMLSIDRALPAIRDVGLTREQIATWFMNTEELVYDTSLTGLIAKMKETTKTAVVQSLQSGIVTGQGIPSLVSAIRNDTLRNMTSQEWIDALADGFVTLERDSITIARTAIQVGNVRAMDAVYEANADLLSGWRWVSKLDSRVCMGCAVLDGKIFKFGEGPSLPRHGRCRCLRQPILKKNADLGKPMDEVQRLARTWVERESGNIDTGGRKIIDTKQTNLWYSEWFSHLDASVQDKIVGVKRAEAIRNGDITFDDLADTQTGHVNTLSYLGLK